MNKHAKFLIIALVLPVSILIPVYLAQTISIDSQVHAQASTLQQRIEQYKSKLGTNPNQSQLNRFKLRCGVTQTALKGLQTKVTTGQESRVKVYDKILEDVNTLSAKLKEKSISTTKLDSYIKEVEAKIKQYKTDVAVYKQAVEDAAANDCTIDPLGLQAAIQEARNSHAKLITNVADIRAYVNNVIKPALSQVKTDLQAQQPQSSTPAMEGVTNATQ
jgi:hypothetical protein